MTNTQNPTTQNKQPQQDQQKDQKYSGQSTSSVQKQGTATTQSNPKAEDKDAVKKPQGSDSMAKTGAQSNTGGMKGEAEACGTNKTKA